MSPRYKIYSSFESIFRQPEMIWKFCFVGYQIFYFYQILPFFDTVWLWRDFSTNQFAFNSWIIVSLLASFLFFFKKTYRLANLLFLISLLFLLYKNPLCNSPELNFFKLQYLFMFLFFSAKMSKPDIAELFYWLSFCCSFIYFFAGLSKIMTPSWLDGRLLLGVFSLKFTGLEKPSILHIIFSWLYIATHVLAPIFCYIRRLSAPYHLLMVLNYAVGFYFLTSIRQVVVGMFLYHSLFLIYFFDSSGLFNPLKRKKYEFN